MKQNLLLLLSTVFSATAQTDGQKAAGMGVIGRITGVLLKKKFIISSKKDNYHNSQAELNKRALVKFE